MGSSANNGLEIAECLLLMMLTYFRGKWRFEILHKQHRESKNKKWRRCPEEVLDGNVKLQRQFYIFEF